MGLLASRAHCPESRKLMSRIILGITGSIAAYKAADIASQLTKLSHEVTCVLTKSALEFVTPLTLQTLSRRPVVTDLFAEKDGWQPGHIHLADTADLLLVAPATHLRALWRCASAIPPTAQRQTRQSIRPASSLAD